VERGVRVELGFFALVSIAWVLLCSVCGSCLFRVLRSHLTTHVSPFSLERGMFVLCDAVYHSIPYPHSRADLHSRRR
jgi:hypothetical protein